MPSAEVPGRARSARLVEETVCVACEMCLQLRVVRQPFFGRAPRYAERVAPFASPVLRAANSLSYAAAHRGAPPELGQMAAPPRARRDSRTWNVW